MKKDYYEEEADRYFNKYLDEKYKAWHGFISLLWVFVGFGIAFLIVSLVYEYKAESIEDDVLDEVCQNLANDSAAEFYSDGEFRQTEFRCQIPTYDSTNKIRIATEFGK